MAKKKSEEIESKVEELEVTEEAVEEAEESETSTLELEDFVKQEPTPKKRSKKKKKAEQQAEAPEADESTPSEEPKEETETQEAAAEKPAPKRKRRKSSPRKVEATSEEMPQEVSEITEAISLTSAAMQKSMESMVKQWGTIKEITQSMNSQLGQINELFGTLPTSYSKAVDEIARTQASKVSPSSQKTSVAISAVALVLAFISLVFAQSTRKTVLTQEDFFPKPSFTQNHSHKTQPDPSVSAAPPRASLVGPAAIANAPLRRTAKKPR